MSVPGAEFDALVGHTFGIEFMGIPLKFVNEVSGLKADQDVIEQKSVTAQKGQYLNIKHPGKPKSGEITITRGLTGDKSFDDWVKKAHEGKMGQTKKDGSVIIFSPEGIEVKRYNIFGAWPKTLDIGSLKAGDTSVLTEKLIVTYERMEPA